MRDMLKKLDRALKATTICLICWSLRKYLRSPGDGAKALDDLKRIFTDCPGDLRSVFLG